MGEIREEVSADGLQHRLVYRGSALDERHEGAWRDVREPCVLVFSDYKWIAWEEEFGPGIYKMQREERTPIAGSYAVRTDRGFLNCYELPAHLQPQYVKKSKVGSQRKRGRRGARVQLDAVHQALLD